MRRESVAMILHSRITIRYN